METQQAGQSYIVSGKLKGVRPGQLAKKSVGTIRELLRDGDSKAYHTLS